MKVALILKYVVYQIRQFVKIVFMKVTFKILLLNESQRNLFRSEFWIEEMIKAH